MSLASLVSLNNNYMSDHGGGGGGHGASAADKGEIKIRRLISALGTLTCLLAYFSGYISGSHGWWWTSILVAIAMYRIIYHLVEA